MKISEHLNLLIKAESILNNIKSDLGISKDSIDFLLTFYKELDNVDFGSLFDQQEPGRLYLKYKEQLLRVKLLFIENQSAFSYSKIYDLIDAQTQREKWNYEEHQKILHHVSNQKLGLNGKLESCCVSYSEEDPKEYQEIRLKFKSEQLTSKRLLKEWNIAEKKFEYLLYFNDKKTVSKLDEIEKALTNLNVFGNSLKKILIDENSIHFIYHIFVKLKLIEYVEYSDFINQIANNFFSFKKFAGKDKYIAYAINKISTELVAPEFALNWEKEMAEYFEINDFEKKINPSEDNKADLHLEIDVLILEAKMSQNNIKDSKKKS